MTRNEVLSTITKFYLNSGDYNGFPVRSLLEQQDVSKVRKQLALLVEEGLISIVFGDRHPNPNIKALEPEPVEAQLEKLGTEKLPHACVYPEVTHLREVVDATAYVGRPFELCLALGEPQLAHKSFDLSILEAYRNDPRYYYNFDDVCGRISVHDDFFESDTMKISDQVLLQTFGLALDEHEHVYVAVFLRYLSRLSAEHQSIWASKQTDSKTFLHPDYYRTAIIGDWPQRLSLYKATLLEMQAINDLTIGIKGVPFWREDFRGRDRPREFRYLLRPTLKEWHNFVHLLDKMLSDNMNRAFFEDDVPLKTEEERKDGRVVVREKGTIQALQYWLTDNFETDDRSHLEEMLLTLRHVRVLRQKPAHAIKEDDFDQKYVHDQREMMIAVYRALKTLRLVFALHPKASGVKVSRHLMEGLIWSI